MSDGGECHVYAAVSYPLFGSCLKILADLLSHVAYIYRGHGDTGLCSCYGEAVQMNMMLLLMMMIIIIIAI
jgi:hypothetical protein